MTQVTETTETEETVAGSVKWFDAGKGFGFVLSDDRGPDILLHANVLRNFGRASVTQGARVKLRTLKTHRGMQATEVLSIETLSEAAPEGQAGDEALPDVSDVPLVAARVKWFDKAKGFGFANAFGNPEDVFVHIEVLRRFGFAELQPGEAVALRIVDGPRGKMAAEIHTWDQT